MSDVKIVLKRAYDGDWKLHAPKGHVIAPPFRGNETEALAWAWRYVSSWYNWVIILENKDGNQEEDRLPKPFV